MKRLINSCLPFVKSLRPLPLSDYVSSSGRKRLSNPACLRLGFRAAWQVYGQTFLKMGRYPLCSASS